MRVVSGGAWSETDRMVMDYDAIIIGCGNNGLVAAFYLARAGLRVLGLERNAKVGGACATDELIPGFHFSTCAHSFVLFHPKILQDMRLESYGLHVYNREPEMFQPFSSGKHLLFSNDLDRTLESIGRISRHDAASYPQWAKFWADAGEMFEPYLLTPPPTFGEFARKFEGTAREDLFHKLIMGTTRGILDEFFESNEMKAATVSTYDSGSTDAPGALLYRAFHASVSNQLAAIGKVGYPRGGMGAVATALRESAEAAGAEFLTNAGVARTIIHDNRAVGVELQDGTEILARVVLSNADPRKTFLKLVGSDNLEPHFARRVRLLHADAGYMKLHCAANSLPDWTALPGVGPLPHHYAQARISRGPDILDTAWTAARTGRLPEQYPLAVVCPSLYDTASAPDGKYAVSVWVEFAPIRPHGQSWDGFRDEAAATIVNQIEEFAPNFGQTIEHSYLHTPQDIEAMAGITDGSMHHIDMTPDQMLALRPLRECSAYRTPVAGLYLCGSGAHPGGGVSGMPGHNAAAAVIEDLE